MISSYILHLSYTIDKIINDSAWYSLHAETLKHIKTISIYQDGVFGFFLFNHMIGGVDSSPLGQCGCEHS